MVEKYEILNAAINVFKDLLEHWDFTLVPREASEVRGEITVLIDDERTIIYPADVGEDEQRHIEFAVFYTALRVAVSCNHDRAQESAETLKDCLYRQWNTSQMKDKEPDNAGATT